MKHISVSLSAVALAAVLASPAFASDQSSSGVSQQRHAQVLHQHRLARPLYNRAPGVNPEPPSPPFATAPAPNAATSQQPCIHAQISCM